MQAFYWKLAEILALRVWVVPGGSKEAILGIASDAQGRNHLKIKLTAQATEGKANRALIVYISKYFGISKGSISIASGKTSRQKTLHLPYSEETLALLKKWEDAL